MFCDEFKCFWKFKTRIDKIRGGDPRPAGKLQGDCAVFSAGKRDICLRPIPHVLPDEPDGVSFEIMKVILVSPDCKAPIRVCFFPGPDDAYLLNSDKAAGKLSHAVEFSGPDHYAPVGKRGGHRKLLAAYPLPGTSFVLTDIHYPLCYRWQQRKQTFECQVKRIAFPEWIE